MNIFSWGYNLVRTGTQILQLSSIGIDEKTIGWWIFRESKWEGAKSLTLILMGLTWIMKPKERCMNTSDSTWLVLLLNSLRCILEKIFHIFWCQRTEENQMPISADYRTLSKVTLFLLHLYQFGIGQTSNLPDKWSQSQFIYNLSSFSLT